MQQAGQVPHLDQNDAHEQSLGQSDGSLPGPEQTLNQSILIEINQKQQSPPLGTLAYLSFSPLYIHQLRL